MGLLSQDTSAETAKEVNQGLRRKPGNRDVTQSESLLGTVKTHLNIIGVLFSVRKGRSPSPAPDRGPNGPGAMVTG